MPFYDTTTYSGRDENKRYIISHVLYSNYQRGKYYILKDGQYIISNNAFDPNETYYSYID